MSDLGTKIMAAGLVDEGLYVESMESELENLKKIISDNKPVCPICGIQMTQNKYKGYYDSFSYWGCNCESFPKAPTWNGQYA